MGQDNKFQKLFLKIIIKILATDIDQESNAQLSTSTKARRRPKDSWLERLQAWIVIHVFLWERAHRKIAG